MDNYSQAYRRYHDEENDQPQVIGKCENCKQILTGDYTIYSDNEGNLFCSCECALECHGIEEYDW